MRHRSSIRLTVVLVLASAGLASSALADDTARSFEAELAAGAGIAHRAVEIPTGAGQRELDTYVFPALEIGLRIRLRVSDRVSLGLASHYQTSVGLMASETEPMHTHDQSELRSHRADLGAVGVVQFGRTRDRGQLRIFAGWALRGLRTTSRIAMPAYTLGGPVFRPELELPIGGGIVRLGVAPELIYVVVVGRELRNAGDTASDGFGVGGELRVLVPISTQFELGIAYRESHIFVTSAWESDATDAERFATAHLALWY